MWGWFFRRPAQLSSLTVLLSGGHSKAWCTTCGWEGRAEDQSRRSLPHCQCTLASRTGLVSLVGMPTLETKGRKYFKCSGLQLRRGEMQAAQV